MTVVTGFPGTIGPGPWTGFTPENLRFADGNSAVVPLDTLDEYGQNASSFGFAIPADATITSLTVQGRYCFGLGTGSERFLDLIPLYDGVYYGIPAIVDLAADEDASEWAIVEGVATVNLPTVAQLNSGGFAVQVFAHRHAGPNMTVYLDYIELIVEYDEYVPPPPPDATVPTVVTAAVEAITPNWASSSGTVTSDGGSPVTDRGIIWGGGGVTLDTAAGRAGSTWGLGSYSCTVTPLEEEGAYCVRAYAINAVGVAYGADVYFSTPRGRPTVVTAAVGAVTGFWASSGGTVTYEGWNAPVTDRGIVWGAGGVTLETAAGQASSTWGLGDYYCTITDLVPAGVYSVRAYAINSYGVAYGADVYFQTLAAATVVTTAITTITPWSATSGGTFTSVGGGAVTDRGICWGTSPHPRDQVHSGDSTNAFAQGLIDLEPGTRYFVAAYATTMIGAPATTYGADVTFVTHSLPTIATAGVYDIDATIATSGGNVASDGGEAVTARGVCWGIAENPTTAANIIPAMTSDTAPSGVASASSEAIVPAWGAFNHLQGAGAADRWVINATTGWLQYRFATAKVITGYALTSQGYVDGPYTPKSWTFQGSNDGAAWTTLDTRTNITSWAAQHGQTLSYPFANTTAYTYYRLNIIASNGASYVGVGELEMMETVDDTLDGSGLGAFVSALTGLTEGVTYNVRAYAVNVAGTAYGAAVIFTATEDAPPAEPPPGPPRDPSKNFLFDGTLELLVGTLDVAGSATQVKYSNSNPGGFGNLSFRLPADAPYAAFDAQVVKGAAVTMKHGLVGFVATLFEGEVTSDVSHATIAGGKGYYDVTCAGLWWKAGRRKDFSMVVGDDAYDQWFTMDDNAKAFQVSTDGKLEIRLEAGQSVAAGDSASLYYWLGKGMGDPAASIDYLIGMSSHNTTGANWHAEVSSALTPWGPWTTVLSWGNGAVTGYPICFPITGTTPQALRFKLYTSSAVDALAEDRFVRLDKAAVGSGVSANALSAVSVANPAVVTSTSAHGLKTGDRVFILQTAASTPTISGWRTVTVTNATHFTVPVAVTTAGGAGTFYKATRVDQALVDIAVTPGLATLASLQPGGIGNLNWGLVVRPHASRAGGIDLLAATNVAPFDYGFWDNKTFYCQDRPETIRALHDYLIDSSLPGIDFDVRRATEDSPTTVKVLYKFRAEDGETGGCPDGTALAVYRSITTHTITYTANIIPAMTSATAPSGVASSSGNYNASTVGWKAFNHTNVTGDDGWLAAAGTTGWVGYQYLFARVISRYAITSRDEAPNSRAPKTWTFKGSNDGAAWTTLDTQTNVTDWAATANVRKVFPLANTTAYAYYRLDITASNDASYVGVGELEMMEAADWVPEWSDASVVLDVWNEWADLSLTTAQAGDLCDQILAWLSANAYQGGGTIAPATLPLRAEGTKPVAYIRAGDYIEDSNLATGRLMITGFSMDADRGIATLGIGENRRAFVERLTPDKA